MKSSLQAFFAVFSLSAMMAMPAGAELVVIDEGPESAPSVRPAIAVPAPAEKTGGSRDQTDILEFINRDKLHGSLLSVAPGQSGLKWKHESSAGEMEFTLPCIASVTLSKRPAGNKAAQTSMIRLTNDDMLEGNVISLDDSKLVIDTWYAGKVEIKRPMVKMLTPNSVSANVVYEGPNDLAEWTINKNMSQPSWKFKNGALLSINTYPIGKMIENMPDMADIQFEVSWKRYPSFQFCFFTDNLQQYYGNCYMIQVGGSSIYLQRYSQNGGSQNLGRLNIESFNNNTISKARFNVMVDKKKKAFTLMINGQMVKQWSDPGNFAGMGNGILFQPQDSMGIKVTGVRVSQWNGQVPGAPDAATESKEDNIRLVNNDKVSGQIKSIADGNIKFATSYATMDIPVARAACMEFSQEKSERARRNKDDIKATFADKGLISMQITSLNKEKVTGTSENFGNMSIPLGALRRIEFNIYREKDTSDDDDSDL